MTGWLHDVRIILRGWRRTPGFFATIVLTLVLSLGLASAVFAFADSYLFKTKLFPGSDRLYRVRDPNDKVSGLIRATDQELLRNSRLGHLGFAEFSHSDRLLGHMVVDDRRVEIRSYEVSPGFHKTVRLPLLAGRDFSAVDHTGGEPVPVWLSHRFWKSAFRSDVSVLNKTYNVLAPFDKPVVMMVAGILGPQVTSFDGNNQPPDVIVPATIAPANPNWLAYPIVRLPEGMSPAQAEGQIAAILRSGAPAKDGVPRAAQLRSFQESQVAGGTPTARLLFAGALLIVLLASVNLVHLLLTRGASRAAEVATRTALGASRWRVARLFLSESAMLGAIGIAGGLLMGSWLASLISTSIPDYPTRGRNMAMVAMSFDWRVVGFAVVLGVAMALVGGIWPAWRALRYSLHVTTRTGSTGIHAVSSLLFRWLLASQLALTTMVMIGTMFIGLGIWRYLNQPLGFDLEDRFSIGIAYSSDFKRATAEDVEAAYRAIRSVPGVSAAGPRGLAVNRGAVVEVPGVAVDPKQLSVANARPGYSEAMNLRARAGRWFTPDEFTGSQPVVVVDERMARMAWPNASAIGRQVRVAGVIRDVIGVVEPVRTSLSRPQLAQLYVPALPVPAAESLALVWAPGASLTELQPRINAAIRGVLPGAWIQMWPMTMDRWFSREIGEARFQTPLVLGFGLLAFAMAGIGIFGLVSYLVERRQREFGIRLALGARSTDIWRSVIRLSVIPAIAGLVIGTAGAVALESVVRASAFGWESSGFVAVASVAVALLSIAVLAAAAPARRAMRTDPAITLRAE